LEACGAVLCGVRGWLMPGDTNYSDDDGKIYERELLRLRLSLESAVKTAETIAVGAASALRNDAGTAPTIICGLHYPPTAGGPTSAFTELFEEFGVRKVVYGHLHGKEAYKKGLKGIFGGVEYILASADYLDFNPVLIYDGNRQEEK